MKYHSSEQFTLYNGNSKQILPTLPENSIDSIVTDPPYELGFMGKSWDSTGVANDVELWKEVLRVLKPGGYLLSFGGSRTYHRMAVAIEDAGFEIRDQIMWVYGSGFPKSLNIDKAIDKAAGVEREILGVSRMQPDIRGNNYAQGKREYGGDTVPQYITEPSTDLAKQWQGWGTALKPAHEPIVLARKPFTGTVVNNVLSYGTGGINIDKARVIHNEPIKTMKAQVGGDKVYGQSGRHEQTTELKEGGRWPANFIHDGSNEVVELFPDSKGMASQKNSPNSKIYGGNSLTASKTTFPEFREGFNDSGSAARFFYCAKAGKRDRNEGLDSFNDKEIHRFGAGIGEGKTPNAPSIEKNHHPTVKPTDLMQYLCRLITPPNGTILDPFLGSGSTGKAAMYEGFKFVGIELTDEYLPIAKARIEFALSNLDEKLF
jgi:site-specific DNA-methyltransferase (adenine-specific)